MDVTLLLKALIAIAPVLILLLVFDRLDIFNLVSFRDIGRLLLAGGAIAIIGLFTNTRALDGFPIGFSAYTRYVSPVIEESLKAIPILVMFATNRLGFKLDSAIAGFAIGAGFSVVENGWFLSTLADANFSAWLVRGFGTAIMHGGATALFAVISHEFTEHQAEANAAGYKFDALLFLPGLAAAIFVHSAFNHFPGQPLLAMTLTLLLVPLTLFIVFMRSERASHIWIQKDHDAHRRALEDIRSGRFATSEAGTAIAQLTEKIRIADAADVFAYAELKTELVLRAEEIMLARENGVVIEIGAEERAKFVRLDGLEQRLGNAVMAAIGPSLGFSRNDLWDLSRLRQSAFKKPRR